MRFRVEYIYEKAGYVIAKQLDAGPFELSEASRLNGRPIEPVLTQPRALDEHGAPRLDLFVFRPQGRLDRWQVGSIVVLTKDRRFTSSPG